MKPIDGTIENDLRKLQDFCEYEKLCGTLTMLWINALIARYPSEYLLYSKDTPFHRPYREKARARIAKQVEV
jgi:hypothetical protein